MKRFIACSLMVFATLFAVLLVPGLTRAQAAPQDMQVTLSEFMFMPSSFTAMQGQTIHFTATNTGKYPHNITFSKGGATLNVFAQPLKGGATGTADFVFPEAGAWRMYCPVGNHADKGMVGTVQVLTASAPGMPTTGEPAGTPLVLAGLLGLFLLANGLLLRRRRAARAA